jgi:hypothetical protein
MSKERDIISTTGKIIPLQELPPEQQRARIAQVLDRGVVGVRMQVDLPPGVYGEWASNDVESIFRMQTLGFEIDHIYAKQRALHNDGTDKSIVGDVVFMTCSQQNKDLIEAVRREKYNKDNRKRTDLPEENVVGQIGKEGLPVTNSSSQEFVGTGQIKTAVETA